MEDAIPLLPAEAVLDLRPAVDALAPVAPATLLVVGLLIAVTAGTVPEAQLLVRTTTLTADVVTAPWTEIGAAAPFPPMGMTAKFARVSCLKSNILHHSTNSSKETPPPPHHEDDLDTADLAD